MNLDNLNKWLTLGANLGVLVGIFALVIELQHSSRLAQVNAYQTRNSEIVNASVELALSQELSDLCPQTVRSCLFRMIYILAVTGFGTQKRDSVSLRSKEAHQNHMLLPAHALDFRLEMMWSAP